MKKRVGYVLILPAGMFLLVWGLFLESRALSGLLIGLGAIALGLGAAFAVPGLARKDEEGGGGEIEWRDERNMAIREKSAWYSGAILMAAMTVGAFVLALTDQLIGACVIAGLLLLYCVCLIIFSVRFSKKL